MKNPGTQRKRIFLFNVLIFITCFDVNSSWANTAFVFPAKSMNSLVLGLDGSPDEELFDISLQYLFGFYSLGSFQIRGGAGFLSEGEKVYGRFGMGIGVGELVMLGEVVQTFEEQTTTAFCPGFTLLLHRHWEAYLAMHIYMYHRESNPDFFVLGVRYIF